MKSKLSGVSTKVVGLIVIALVLLGGYASFQKGRIGSFLSSGDTVNAEFSRDYKLVDFQGQVKLAGVVVGEVTGVEDSGRNSVIVSMRVDPGVTEKLGNEPSAAIRATLVVGGIYYVSLVPGGMGNEFESGGTIPAQRTTVPVELDRVLSTLTPPALQGVQSTLRQTDATLARGGEQQLRRLVQTAPGTLGPATPVVESVNGTRPGVDIPQLVGGLQKTAAVLNRRDGQLGAIIDNLESSTAALASSRKPLAETIRTGPETLRVTRTGLKDLQGTLDRLVETAPKFRKSAQRLEPVLKKLDPVLKKARPVVSDLNELLDDARPLLKELNPTVKDVTQAFDDIRGPVLDRVNGPIMDALNSDFQGTGVYEGGGSDSTLYEEAGYLASVGADVFKFRDQTGGMARLMAGVGFNTATGGARSPLPLEQVLEMGGLQQPLGPQEFRGKQAESGVPGLPPLPTGGPR